MDRENGSGGQSWIDARWKPGEARTEAVYSNVADSQ